MWTPLASIRHALALRKLERMVLANREAPATVSYRKHREAALRGRGRS